MARIRSIKPDFWTDEKIVELSAFARLLFIGLWNFADDDGRMVYSPKKIKMQVFPADNLDISELFEEIRRESLISVYVVDGVEYLQIKNFALHQKIDKRTTSKYPTPPKSPKIPPTSPDFPQIPTTDMEGNGREGKGTTTPSAENPSAGIVVPACPTTEGAIAGELRKLGVSITSQNPILRAWVADGFSLGRICEAVELARMSKPAPHTIPAAYLDAIVRKPEPSERPNAPPPVVHVEDTQCRHVENKTRCQHQGVKGKNGFWYCHEHKHPLEIAA
jgi:hypothetical protein